MDLSVAPSAPVSGAVDDAPFTLRDAWFRVEQRPGRERVDLVFSEGRATRLCATSEPEDARHLWVRLAGTALPSIGEFQATPSRDGAVSAHWEARTRGRWQGRPGALRMRLDTVTEDLAVGVLRACFGPGDQGCVAGSFQARRCVTELDPEGPLAGNVRRASRDGGPSP
jgi:hypothetical protein